MRPLCIHSTNAQTLFESEELNRVMQTLDAGHTPKICSSISWESRWMGKGWRSTVSRFWIFIFSSLGSGSLLFRFDILRKDLFLFPPRAVNPAKLKGYLYKNASSLMWCALDRLANARNWKFHKRVWKVLAFAVTKWLRCRFDVFVQQAPHGLTAVPLSFSQLLADVSQVDDQVLVFT